MKKKVLIIGGVVLSLILGATILEYCVGQEGDNQWQAYYTKKKERREKGLPGNKKMRVGELTEYFHQIRTKWGEEESNYPANYLMTELNKVRSTLKAGNAAGIHWELRGPGNVGGRTRSVIVDITDPTNATWFAGSATGGIWKTTDEGANWTNISSDIPYQSISSVVQAPSNRNVLYAGTGESFPGAMGTTGGGVFKSTDKGNSWTHCVATGNDENFRFVNRIIVSNTDEDIILAATNFGIYKSINGGDSWNEVYASDTRVEHIVSEPNNFSVLYAGVNSQGVMRSLDAGDTWSFINNGFLGGNNRYELAVSPSNPSRIFASVGNNSRGSDLYVSSDKGDQWYLVKNTLGLAVDYLGGQASYDNAIAVHPYHDDTVFVAGVNSWKIAISNSFLTQNALTDFNTEEIENLISFVDFGGPYPGIEIGDNEESVGLSGDDYVSVEIRFGPGLSQKAHRFTVPDQATSGVPAADYTYQDYVDVPFEVWDVDNNVQLMCSFRDQEKDGAFNLYETIGENYGERGREYLFINSVPYNADAPDVNIATQGGRSYKLIYFLWPELTPGATWEPENMPEVKAQITWGEIEYQKGAVFNVSDAYGEYSGRNTYDSEAGQSETHIPGFHPDHHVLTIVPISESENKFWVVNGNDGGLGLSKDNGFTFQQFVKGYVTSQFHGISKKPGANEYIGGMQDNGTWQSPKNAEATAESDYVFRIGGDGFQTVWHATNPDKMMGSVYFNQVMVSTDGGRIWNYADAGMSGDGPFVTKLTMIPRKPDRVYAVGSRGLWYTGNFGASTWREKVLPSGWSPIGYPISSHEIKYSIANDSILWAGAALAGDWRIYVSTDLARKWTEVNMPETPINAYISGLETHPTREETAYLIYSIYGEGKILRTEDLGQTWEDITGFNGGSSSNNGFPDVGCLSLMAFPDNPDRLWAGTELGIVESLDNGESWHLLNSDLPTVPINQIFYQDDQVVVGTFGRGIWSYDHTPETPTSISSSLIEVDVNVYPNPSSGIVHLNLSNFTYDANITIKVYDMAGRIVMQRLEKSNHTIQLDLSGQAKGQYMIRIEAGNEISTQKVSLL
ncbi:T9SS type A sorting domain-containing protein [Labilibacter sediminis]|nr:T9SS type A sorting domain-containing protein [Labilibacter sediminis]